MNHLDVPGRNLRKVGRLWFEFRKGTLKLYDDPVRVPQFSSEQFTVISSLFLDGVVLSLFFWFNKS
jgi:hypothetical protein